MWRSKRGSILKRQIKKAELAIIGSGPAGLAAASEAVAHGMLVTLFDDNSMPGGQYLRQMPKSFQSTAPTVFDREKAHHTYFLKLTNHPNVQYMNGTIVWGVFNDKVITYTNGIESGHINADYIIIATGAFDKAVPFPGWTLPGVITAGGIQNLIKGQRIVPGGRILIAGNGPLVLSVAYNLHRAGCKIVEVLETSQRSARAFDLLRLLSVPSLLMKGFFYSVALFTAGIPVKRGMSVLEARGDMEVAEVLVAPINHAGRVNRSKARSIKTEILVSGFGLTSSSEITRLLGCEHVYSSFQGGWIPLRSPDLETSTPGVFAVGDCASIKGAEIAFLEGRIAGLNVAMRASRETYKNGFKKIRSLRRRLSRLNHFRSGIERFFAPPNNFLSLITNETIICRCEDVTAGEIYDKIHGNIYDINSIKTLTRTGMGRCQGRNCLGTLAEIVDAESKCELSDSAFPRVRPPVKPISIENLF